MELARCARPAVRGRSTYTVIGFAGYVIASVAGALLAHVWDFALAERLVALVAPPVAFIVVVTIATVLKGREWIVFYQATFGAVAAVLALGLALDLRVWRLLDLTVLGTGVWLVLGRLGCFHVACCHGRLAKKRGVIYGPAHVAVGFWRRWEGRPLVPVQLLESAGSLALVLAGLLASATPGTATLVYGTGYSLLRFALELLRGDPARPYAYGLSEAQWWCLGTAALCALAGPSLPTLAALALVAAGAGLLFAKRRARELVQPQHLHELDKMCDAILADPARARRDTRLGLGASVHALPDGRLDWVMSSTHPAWSVTTARTIAHALWPGAEIVEGRTPGVIHVLVPR